MSFCKLDKTPHIPNITDTTLTKSWFPTTRITPSHQSSSIIINQHQSASYGMNCCWTSLKYDSAVNMRHQIVLLVFVKSGAASNVKNTRQKRFRISVVRTRVATWARKQSCCQLKSLLRSNPLVKHPGAHRNATHACVTGMSTTAVYALRRQAVTTLRALNQAAAIELYWKGSWLCCLGEGRRQMIGRVELQRVKLNLSHACANTVRLGR